MTMEAAVPRQSEDRSHYHVLRATVVRYGPTGECEMRGSSLARGAEKVTVHGTGCCSTDRKKQN